MKLRKAITWLLPLLGGGLLYAQSTAVTSTGVVDSDGFTWSGGTVTANFVPAPNFPNFGSYTWTGGTLQSTYYGVLNGSGALAISLPSNVGAIQPSGSLWKLTFCPNATSGCFPYLLNVSGTTQDITAGLNAVLPGPRFGILGFPYGYGPVEINVSVPTGTLFFNSTTDSCTQYNGSSWQSCGTSIGNGSNVQVNSSSTLATANLTNNTGAGEIDFTHSGSTVNATLHNTSTTVNGTPCTLGSTCTISGGSPTGSAGGDLAGTYPNPTIGATTNSTFTTLSSLSLPYSQLTGTPSIPSSSSWPNAGTCTAGQYVESLVNGSVPTCAMVQYSQLGGTVPTWNQNTTGTAANITATSNSTITTLSSLSLPYSQVTGTPTLPSSISSVSHKWLNSYTSGTGAFTQTQPACGDLSDSATGCSATALPPNGSAGGSLSGTYPNPGLASQYPIAPCSVGLYGGGSAITAGTYTVKFRCENDYGVTYTITGISCAADNSGTSTGNASDSASNALLTGAITMNSANTFVAGTQSSHTTIGSGVWTNWTFVADGTSTVLQCVMTTTR